LSSFTDDYPRLGDILFADLPINGSVQGGFRPVLVVQNDVGNKYSSTIEVLPISSKIFKGSHLPTHVFISPDKTNGLKRESIIMAENVWTIPKDLIISKIGCVSRDDLFKVAGARYVQSPLPYLIK